jgi:hypothetical protein
LHHAYLGDSTDDVLSFLGVELHSLAPRRNGSLGLETRAGVSE